MVLKQGFSAPAVWKSRFAVLRARQEVVEDTNPFRASTYRLVAAELLLFTDAECRGPARRELKLEGKTVREFARDEVTRFGGGGIVVEGDDDDGGGSRAWFMRALTEAEAEVWRSAIREAAGPREVPRRRYGTAASVAACAAAAAVSAGATALTVAGVATGVGAAAAAGTALVVRRRRRSAKGGVTFTPPIRREPETTDDETDDPTRYGRARVEVSRARVVRSGGADDALPPTLKVEGDYSTETMLESTLVVVARCGDQVAASRPIVRASDLDRVCLEARFRIASARTVLRLELRALPPSTEHNAASGTLLAARAVTVFELLERDAEIDVRNVRKQVRALRRLLIGGVTPVPPDNDDDDKEEDSSSEDEPLRHARFRARPVENDDRAAWYPLARSAAMAKKHEAKEKKAEAVPTLDDLTPVDEAESGLFVEGACDDASGVKAGTVGALVEARVELERGAFYDALRRDRAEVDRPPRDAAPDPRAILELLRRGMVVVAWATGLSKKCDALLRWDDWRQSLAAALVSALFVVLWARDHCFALPPAASLVGLLAMGWSRLNGDWLARRVAVLKDPKSSNDDDLDAAVVASYKDDGHGRRKWRLLRPRDVATLRVSIPRLDLVDANGLSEPLVVLKFVPGAARAALDARQIAASCLVSAAYSLDYDQPPETRRAARRVRAACRDALDALTRLLHQGDDNDDDDDPPPGLAAPLRAFKIGRATFVRCGGSTYAPKVKLAEDAPPPDDDDDAPGRLATSAPARVGLGSRAQYEAERLLRWTSQLVGTSANHDDDDPGMRSSSHTPAATAKYHERIRAGLRDPRRSASATRADPTSWTVPVLRELERDGGGNAYTAAIPMSWSRARGHLRIEVYDARSRYEKDRSSSIARRPATTTCRAAVVATAFADRASPYYCAPAVAADGASPPPVVVVQGRNSDFEDADDDKEDLDDALGLAPRSDARLLGVATLPLSRATAHPRARWLDVVAPEASKRRPRRWWTRLVVHDSDEPSADVLPSSSEEPQQRLFSPAVTTFSEDDDQVAPPSLPPTTTSSRYRVRVECQLEDDAPLSDGVSLSRWHALDTLEEALELPDGERTRRFLEGCRDAADALSSRLDAAQPSSIEEAHFVDDDRDDRDDQGATPNENDPPGSSAACSSTETQTTPLPSPHRGGNEGGGFALFERLRRARKSAVETQNSIHDMVRVLEQWRALVEWAHPRSTAVVVLGLGVATYVAARTRADVAGLAAVVAAFGSGLFDRCERALRRAARRTELRRLADECELAAADALATRAATSACASACAEALRSAATSLAATHGAAERQRAATTKTPEPKPAVWRSALASLLEGLPSEPELDAIFAERRRAAEWRRERRAVARTLDAAWVGPLWRRSTAWRRHFAAVRDRQLCFWYSARHALAGVSPVLVVLLKNATLVAPPIPPTRDVSEDASDRPPPALSRRTFVDSMSDDKPPPPPPDEDLHSTWLESGVPAHDLPVLTLHAPVLTAPDKRREWRLAAAHYRDAAKLRRCIETQSRDSDDDDNDDSDDRDKINDTNEAPLADDIAPADGRRRTEEDQ